MFSKVREDVHVVEVAVDGVQVLQDRKTMESILVNMSPFYQANTKRKKEKLPNYLALTYTHKREKLAP